LQKVAVATPTIMTAVGAVAPLEDRLDRSLSGHTPDPLTPIEETICTLDDLITQGKFAMPAVFEFAAGK